MLPFQMGRIKLDNRATYGALRPVVNAADLSLPATCRPVCWEPQPRSLWFGAFCFRSAEIAHAQQRALRLAVDRWHDIHPHHSRRVAPRAAGAGTPVECDLRYCNKSKNFDRANNRIVSAFWP